jgi:hypothetical protein
MKLLRNYTFKWYQVSLLKVYVLSVGLLIGAHYPAVVMEYRNILLAVFGVLVVYFVWVVVKGKV